MLGGRVKTLHPAVHGGILARDIPSDKSDLEAQSISPISIVVCNLYPFTETIAKPNCTLPDAVEEIDIGGVTLLRAAAKNHARVSILSDPKDYTSFLKSWKEGQGDVGDKLRKELALKAFEMTATYDEAISGYFREKYASSDLGEEERAGQVQRMPLRYGANPHQKPAQAYVTEGALPFKGMLLLMLNVESHANVNRSPLRLSWIYQPPRRPQLIRTRQGAPRSSQPPRCRFLQGTSSSAGVLARSNG